MKRNVLPLVVAAVLLLAVDWLAFHDIREPHTFRDYLTLIASLLVFLGVGWELLDTRIVEATARSPR